MSDAAGLLSLRPASVHSRANNTVGCCELTVKIGESGKGELSPSGPHSSYLYASSCFPRCANPLTPKNY